MLFILVLVLVWQDNWIFRVKNWKVLKMRSVLFMNLRDKGYPAVPVGDKVAVIGMGMTAIDAATQAKRLGAKEVTMVYRRTRRRNALHTMLNWILPNWMVVRSSGWLHQKK